METTLSVLIVILLIVVSLQGLLIDKLRKQINKLAQVLNSLVETLIRASRK